MRGTSQTVTVVGSGNLARALVELLPGAGCSVVEVVTRGGASRKRAAALARRTAATVSILGKSNPVGTIVWLAVSDRAIRECAEVLAVGSNWKGKTVLHSSGALTSDELQPLRRKGAAVASLHPMMTFVNSEVPPMKGVVWALEGDPKAVGLGRRLARGFGGKVRTIKKGDKPAYHAFGAFLSPLLVVLLTESLLVAERAGIKRSDARNIMAPIVRQTLKNFFDGPKRNNPGYAFSGPIVRGDVDTVRKHIRVLKGVAGAERLYKALIEAAIHSGLPVKNATALRKLAKGNYLYGKRVEKR